MTEEEVLILEIKERNEKLSEIIRKKSNNEHFERIREFEKRERTKGGLKIYNKMKKEGLSLVRVSIQGDCRYHLVNKEMDLVEILPWHVVNDWMNVKDSDFVK